MTVIAARWVTATQENQGGNGNRQYTTLQQSPFQVKANLLNSFSLNQTGGYITTEPLPHKF